MIFKESYPGKYNVFLTRDGKECHFTFRGNPDLDRESLFQVIGAEQSGSYFSSQTPHLGYFRGKLEDVILHAWTLPMFTYWVSTSGGEIQEIEIETIMPKIVDVKKEP